jgi:hypothetical protein
VPAQAAPGHGSSGAGVPFGDRGGGRNVSVRRNTLARTRVA